MHPPGGSSCQSECAAPSTVRGTRLLFSSLAGKHALTGARERLFRAVFQQARAIVGIPVVRYDQASYFLLLSLASKRVYILVGTPKTIQLEFYEVCPRNVHVVLEDLTSSRACPLQERHLVRRGHGRRRKTPKRVEHPSPSRRHRSHLRLSRSTSPRREPVALMALVTVIALVALILLMYFIDLAALVAYDRFGSFGLD